VFQADSGYRLAAGWVWYIDAMIVKGLAALALMVAMVPASASAVAQTGTHPAAGKQAVSPVKPGATNPGAQDCNGGPCEDQQPRYELTCPVPAPQPEQWPIHERILWGAYLVLAILGYVGIMLAVSTLKKIERNTATAEETAKASASAAAAALEGAQAAGLAAAAVTGTARAMILHTEALVSAERPWVLVTAEPTRGVESSFEITATNRGKSPARITSSVDQVVFAVDEAHLPATLEFKKSEKGGRFVPILLLPGESAALRTFSRDDVRGLCGLDEVYAKVESWEERLFLCGKVEYENLIAPAGSEMHTTNWCSWYIHGKQRSALVPAGPAEYNAHS